MALTSPVRAIGEAAQEQGQVESLVGVCYSEDNLLKKKKEKETEHNKGLLVLIFKKCRKFL